jgi:hypothetical protein
MGHTTLHGNIYQREHLFCVTGESADEHTGAHAAPLESGHVELELLSQHTQ